MKQSKIVIISLLATMLIFNGCSSSTSDNNEENTVFLPKSIEVNASGLYPEGIAFNSADNRFYLSSYHQGKIVSVEKNGTIKPFFDDSSLITIVGMKVDTKNNRLIVCNTDLGYSIKSSPDSIGRMAKVEVFDISTKKKIKSYDLSSLYQGGHFANDLALDKEGNIYVTDSFSPVIYKISTEGNMSVFSTSEQFAVEQNEFGLNGIVVYGDYLIVAKSKGAKLFRIALNNGADIKEITVDKALNSIDGLLLNTNNELLVSSNNFTGQGFDEAVYKLSSADKYSTAKVIGTFKVEGMVYPTTLTNIKETVYVNYSYLPKLITKQPNVELFKIEQVIF